MSYNMSNEEASKKPFDGEAVIDNFTFRLWEKKAPSGKIIRRIYINPHNTNKGGYIDLNGMVIFASGNAAFAAREFLKLYKVD